MLGATQMPPGQAKVEVTSSRTRPMSAGHLPRRPLFPLKAANIGQNTPTPPSGHPDALRRREQAAARKAAAQVDAERAQCKEWWEGYGPMNVVSVASPEAFKQAITQDRLVVVDFFAPWCAACRRLFPALMKLAENNPDVLFLKVNGGDAMLSKFVESLAVEKLPYFHFYRSGTLVSQFAANLTKINVLRVEIAAQKECTEPYCYL